MTQTNTYDPEQWLVSTTRALKEFVDNAFNAAYEVIMEFPSTDTVMKYVPLEKTLIHFEIDDVHGRPLGFGANIGTTNYDETNPGSETVRPQEARLHTINFDVGVWSSDRSGGTTARLRAQQTLSDLFIGKRAQDALDAAVKDGDGRIEILRYEGGRSLTDRINDVDVYRMTGATLEVRVFSRTKLGPLEAPITDILTDENLDIGGVAIS